MAVVRNPLASNADRPRVGRQLRRLRKSRKLTLKEVADRSGLSPAFISLAERDISMPSLVSLYRLAKALEVDVASIMEMPDDASIVRRAASPSIVKVDGVPLVYHELASKLPDRHLDAFLITVPPGYAYPIETRPGEHFRYVIKGELWSKVGQIETVLKPGDSMHFDARLPHGAENRTEDEVVFLYVGTPSFR